MSNSIQYPSISVVIPSYNQGEFIEETLLSVIGQQYPNLEIIVIDGGSTDQTVEILEQYSAHLTYWHSKPDRGQADAINQGFRLSTGEILCWLNSDDMYFPGTLIDIGRRFGNQTDRNHLIYGSSVLINQAGKTQSAEGFQLGEPFDAFKLTYLDFIVQPSTFWTRKLWEEVGELNLDYHYVLDWDWFIRASKVTEFEYVPKFYSIYRMHQQCKTGSGSPARKQEVTQIVNKYSSPYWINLYTEVESSYSEIWQAIRRFRIPVRFWHLILPLLFPKIRRKLERPQHLSAVLAMYGS